MFWDNRVVELLEVEEGMFTVSCQFKNSVDGLRWVFTGVYGSVCRRDKEVFWEELGSIKGLWRDPWCVGGDFNMIRYPEERRRGGWAFCVNKEIYKSGGGFGAKGLSFTGGSFYMARRVK